MNGPAALTTARLADALRRISRYAVLPCLEPIAAFGLVRSGENHIALSGQQVPPPSLVCEGRDNIIIFGADAETRKITRMSVQGSGNVVFLGAHSRFSFLDLAIHGDGNVCYFGSFASANDVRIGLTGDNRRIVIGDRSMLSNHILIGQVDNVRFFSTAGGRNTGPETDIILEEYCWVGRSVVIEPGTRVGAHSVIAQGARVFGRHAGESIIAGDPAEVRRTGIRWARTNEETFEETLTAGHYTQLFQRPLVRLLIRNADLVSQAAEAERLARLGEAGSSAAEPPSPP